MLPVPLMDGNRLCLRGLTLNRAGTVAVTGSREEPVLYWFLDFVQVLAEMCEQVQASLSHDQQAPLDARLSWPAVL